MSRIAGIPGPIAGQALGSIASRIPCSIAGRILDSIAGRILDSIAGRILDSIAGRIPCSIVGRIAGQVLGSMAGRILGLAPRLSALAVIIACGAAAPPAAAPKGPTACERASDSMVGAMLARLPAADAPTERADALRNLIRERCEQDRWSDEATRCLIAMQELDDAAPCAKLLTDDQQAALVRDQEAWLNGGGRGAAGPVRER